MKTYLTFQLDNELFAISVSNVLEVLQKQTVTRVPKTPDHILGIVNFRGEIIPVVNTWRKFHMQQNPEGKQIIIVFETGNENQKFTIAGTADSVRDVIEVADSEIKAVPELGLSYNSKYISGAIRRNEEFILMMDIEKVFSQEDFVDVETLHATSVHIQK